MNDAHWMSLALDQARLAQSVSSPNPPVGCVIVRDGQLLGQGHTQQVGGPHAEVMAMRDAKARGHALAGAAAYVTLEPCAHHGRTPPCADALIREGLGRVVVALHDPNPLVAGQGTARLRAAGIVVDELNSAHPDAIAARETMIGFLSRMVRNRPWVRMKVAASLDGRTALDNGASQWITGPAAREDGQRWRARASAVLTGIGTVLDDNPRLDVRSLPTPRQPLRVVLDSRWRTPPDAALFAASGGVMVVGLPPQDEATEARRLALATAGVQCLIPASAAASSAQDRIDIAWLLPELARQGVNELHVEAGATLNGHLIEGDWVDEILVYLAPKLLGPGRALAALSPLSALGEAWQGEVREVCQVGADVRMIVRPSGRERF